MHTTTPRGTSASPGRRPARLVGAVLAALSASLVFVGSGFAATTAEAPYTGAPTEVAQPAPETPPPTTDPAATEGPVTDGTAAEGAATDGAVTDGTTVTDPAPAPADGSVTAPGIYVPEPVVAADPATPPAADPAPAPAAGVPTVVPVVVPSGPDAVPGVTDHTVVVPFKPDTPVTAVTTTTTGRDSTAAPQVWSAPAVPDTPDAPAAAVETTTVVPVRPEPAPVVVDRAPVATPPSFAPGGRLVDAPDAAAPVVAREVPTVRSASPESLDGAPPPELRTPGITYSGGDGGILEVLAGYVFPGAGSTQSGAILLMFPLALLLAGLMPRLPRLHLQGIVSETGAGARGFDPVALRPG